MNTDLLLTLGLGLLAGVVVVALLLLRGRRRPASTARPPMPAPATTPRRDAPRPANLDAGPAGPPSAADQVNAQRHIATEALRLARQRKADAAARLQAERATQPPPSVAEGTVPRQSAPAPAPTPAPTPLPAATPAPTQVVRATAPLQPVAPPTAGPADRPMLSPLAISTAAPRAVGAAPGLGPLRGAAPPRPPLVLLADDSKVVRTKTGRLLEKQGWQVLLAEDGAAALQALETHAPDLLITDVEMPGLDGFELTRRVRAHARLARLPVIMITSSDERHRAEAHAAGVNLLLGKPYAEETLLAQVQVMLAAAAQRTGTSLTLH